MKSHTRLLTSILLVSAIATSAGCSKNYKKDNHNLEINSNVEQDNFNFVINNEGITNTISDEFKKDNDIIQNNENVINEVVENSISDLKNDEKLDNDIEEILDVQINIEEVLKENLYDEEIDYNSVIDFYLNNYELRDDYKNEYLRAIYMLLYNSNIPMSYYLNELHNMVVMQQVPMGVSRNVWNELFKYLIALDSKCISLFDKYVEFAIYVHSLECKEEHKYNDFNCYTCTELEKEYTRKLT